MKPKTYICGLALLAVLFSLGLAQLFKLRSETGDVYPPYSSLRADPLGTMALCESLGELPGLSVRRDFSAGNQLPDAPDTTYLHLGAEMSEWRELPEEVFKEIEGFVTRGGRLVVTLLPESSRPYLWPLGGPTASPKGSTNAPPGKKAASPRPGSGRKRVSDQEEPMVSLKLRWGVEYGYQRLSAGGAAMHPSVLATRQSDLPLPEELEWHSVVVFTNLPAAWQAIYARGTNPVVIERRFGRATVVMATDSYYLSNEALLKDRHADLLAWLVGPGKQVVFDEAHFGIVETNGVTALIRKHPFHVL